MEECEHVLLAGFFDEKYRLVKHPGGWVVGQASDIVNNLH